MDNLKVLVAAIIISVCPMINMSAGLFKKKSKAASVSIVEQEENNFSKFVDFAMNLENFKDLSREEVELILGGIAYAAKEVAIEEVEQTKWGKVMDVLIPSGASLIGFIVGVTTTIGVATGCYYTGNPWKWIVSKKPHHHQASSSIDSDINLDEKVEEALEGDADDGEYQGELEE